MGYLFFEESKIKQKKSDDRQYESNNSSGIGIQDIEFSVFHNELSKEGDIKQEENNHGQSKSNNNISVDVENISFPFDGAINSIHKDFFNTTDASKQTIANMKSSVKTTNFSTPFFFEKLGTITTTPSQPAARLTNKSDITDRRTGSIDSTLLILVKDKSDVNEKVSWW